MPKPARAPMSKLEKLNEGLTLLRKYQPAAQMYRVGSHLLVGDTTDPHLPEGMKVRMREFGFQLEENRGMFAYPVAEPPAMKPFPKRS
jgi:hypothetical protein